MQIKLLINSSSWTNSYSRYGFDLANGSTEILNFSQVKKNTRIYYDNASLIASNQLTDINMSDPYQKYYNELGVQSRNNYVQVVDDANKIVFNGIYLSARYDQGKKTTSIRVDEAIKILDNVNISPNTLSPSQIIDNVSTSILGYSILPYALDPSYTPYVTEKISFRDYVTLVLQWCRFSAGSDLSFNQKILLWDYDLQKFTVRKLLNNALEPVTINENDIIENSVTIDDGIGFLYNDLKYTWSTGSDFYNSTLTNNSVSIYRSRPKTIEFKLINNSGVALNAIAAFAKFLAQKRQRVSLSLNYNPLSYTLSDNINLGNKIFINITNQLVDIYGYFYIEGYGIDPIRNAIDLDLVEALNNDNF